MIRSGALILLCAALGCTSSQPGGDAVATESPTGDQLPTKLASSVQVEVGGNTVRLVLHVTNPTNQPVALEFSSGQRYDFAIRTAAGQDVWTWSADKSFIQALGTETIAPAGTLNYSEVWEPGNRRGSFVAIARLTSTNHSIREEAAFQIP
jgi:hypothetical protein